jgi:hypothetical protein
MPDLPVVLLGTLGQEFVLLALFVRGSGVMQQSEYREDD